MRDPGRDRPLRGASALVWIGLGAGGPCRNLRPSTESPGRRRPSPGGSSVTRGLQTERGSRGGGWPVSPQTHYRRTGESRTGGRCSVSRLAAAARASRLSAAAGFRGPCGGENNPVQPGFPLGLIGWVLGERKYKVCVSNQVHKGPLEEPDLQTSFWFLWVLRCGGPGLDPV